MAKSKVNLTINVSEQIVTHFLAKMEDLISNLPVVKIDGEHYIKSKDLSDAFEKLVTKDAK